MFLPENYESPKGQGNYLKMEEGEYKLRILSKPILGWEDWTKEKKVLRYRLDNKPKPIDPQRAVKHFWTMIVWSLDEQRIYIWHVTQAKIRKGLEKLISDPDWGSPFGYDVKVTRVGTGLNDTDYFVTPIPHKPVPKEAIEAFNQKPIWLEAMYDGQDPFAEWPDKTPLGVAEAKTADGIISKAQYDELMSYVYADDEYIRKLEENVKKHFNCTIKELPSTKYDALLKSVKLYAKEKAEREQESLPF